MHKAVFVVASGLLVLDLFGFEASAADMLLKAPPAPVSYPWAGFYVGAEGGGALGYETGSTLYTTILSTAGSQTAGNVDGILGGFVAGYNYQVNSTWVLGAEFDWSWTNASGKTSRGSNIPGITLNGTTNDRWVASVTGRAGYVMNNWLLYGRAGAVWMDAAYGANAMAGATLLEVGSTTVTRAGFTVGVGAERRLFGNLTGKVEYDFDDFGTKQVLFTFPGIGSNGANVSTQVHELKAGINYMFRP
jgi:outer membrane immunogenic protein